MHEIVIAMDEDGLIGIENKLPWHIPEELEFFRLLTNRQAVIMGRKTYESIGKPLKNRTNMVITTTTRRAISKKIFAFIDEGINSGKEFEKLEEDLKNINKDEENNVSRITLDNLNTYIKVFNKVGKRVCVIGGKSIYEELIPTANILHISTIKGSFKTGTDKDVFMNIDLSDWEEVNVKKFEKFTYRKYLRRRND